MWPTLFLKKFIRMKLHPNYSLNVVSTSIFWKINGHSYKIAFVGKNTFSTVDKYFSLCCSHICSFFFFRFTHSYFQNLHLHDTFLLHIFTIKKALNVTRQTLSINWRQENITFENIFYNIWHQSVLHSSFSCVNQFW